MNLCDFAENQCAKSVIFLLDREHIQKNEYKRMFQVVDVVRLNKDSVAHLIRKEISLSDEEESDDSGPSQRITRVNETVAFYKFEL